MDDRPFLKRKLDSNDQPQSLNQASMTTIDYIYPPNAEQSQNMFIPSLAFLDQQDDDTSIPMSLLLPLVTPGQEIDSGIVPYSQSSDATLQSLNANRTVCYGMLPAVEVQLKWPPKEYQPCPTRTTSGEEYDLMSLKMEEDHGLIHTRNGSAVGVLSSHMFEAMNSCVKYDGFCTDVWVRLDEWDTQILKVPGPGARKKVIKMRVDLILNGLEDAGSSVAMNLGGRRAFLQDPHGGLNQHPYANPQSLDLPYLAPSSQNAQASLPALLSVFDATEEITDMDESKEADSAQIVDLIVDMGGILEGLQVQRPTTALASRDARMLSPLFSHQQEAVEFMNRKEEPGFSYEGDLWEQKVSQDGETYYQHIITGAKSKCAEKALGGILADDMGLGKTLTTLVAILMSMARAQDYGYQNPSSGRPGESSKATIVIVPSELLLNTWSREIERHFYPGSIRYVKFHGSERRSHESQLKHCDIILTTYSTVMAERRRGTSILHQINWYRLVLDEAHTIRNWSSKQFKAVQDIASKIRWCLTGTPIQNSLDDIGALIKFLNMPMFSEPAIFRKYVTRTRHCKESDKGEFENLRLILTSICLRRNKAIMSSQGHETEDRHPEFSSQERDEYRRLELACKRAITVNSKGYGDEKVHHKVMEALLRLRIFCNNGLSHDSRSKAGGLNWSSRPDEMLSFLQQSGEAMCAYCSIDILSIGGPLDPESPSLTPCWHVVCGECIQQHKSVSGRENSYLCSLCQSEHPMQTIYPDSRSDGESHSSSKVQCLVDDVHKHAFNSKCVVFSFYKSTLDIVGKALVARGIRFLRVDGDISPKKRSEVLQDFQINRTWRVLIMTFSTGAVGLNGLTVANRVHILEPQWNPAVENQAIGRVLRLDQRQKVTIVRYAMRRSIEEVVQSRQLHKLKLAGGGFNTQQERREQRANQLQQLQQYLGSAIDQA